MNTWSRQSLNEAKLHLRPDSTARLASASRRNLARSSACSLFINSKRPSGSPLENILFSVRSNQTYDYHRIVGLYRPFVKEVASLR